MPQNMQKDINQNLLRYTVFAAKVVGYGFALVILLVGTSPCLVFLYSAGFYLKENLFLHVFWLIIGIVYLALWWTIPVLIIFNKLKSTCLIWAGVVVWLIQFGMLQQLPGKIHPDTFKHFFEG